MKINFPHKFTENGARNEMIVIEGNTISDFNFNVSKEQGMQMKQILHPLHNPNHTIT
jgi:hypothetical protein